MAKPESVPTGSVRSRLDVALVDYLAALEAGDLADITVEQIAQLAGVSRATAYRHYGDQQGLLHEAAIKLAREHTNNVIARVARRTTVAAILEEAFLYTAFAMRTDPLLRLLMTSRRSPAIDEAIAALGRELLEPGIRAGQQNGQVRTDLSADDILVWLNEMQYVAIRLNVGEADIRNWVRTYLLPTLNPPVQDAGLVAQVTAVLTSIEQRVTALAESLDEARSPLQQLAAKPRPTEQTLTSD